MEILICFININKISFHDSHLCGEDNGLTLLNVKTIAYISTLGEEVYSFKIFIYLLFFK